MAERRAMTSKGKGMGAIVLTGKSALSRRDLVASPARLISASALSSSFPFCSTRAADTDAKKTYPELLENLESSPESIESVLGYREFREIPFGRTAEEKAPITAIPSQLKISQRATDLIILFEVSSAKVYKTRYERPTLPAGDSGITIGVGYDIGYSTPTLLQADWVDYLDTNSIEVLSSMCGMKGPRASAHLQQAQIIRIPWEQATEQFVKSEQPKYVGLTERYLPNFAELAEDCRGALVSLVYNRGPSFNVNESADPAGRYTEMRNIRMHMQVEDFGAIPGEITSMSRIWANDPQLRGLVIRRSMEASLFTSGLRQT
jgi:hypothetical protein